MKSLKERMINEGLIRKQAGLDLKNQIDKWMIHALFPHEESITKKFYSVNLDLTIQLNNKIVLDCDDEVIPDFIQFADTEHDIQISMPNLKRLSGMPKKCRNFDVSGSNYNNSNGSELETLEGCPRECQDFICVAQRKITDLTGAPQKVTGQFHCGGCTSLTSLEGAPKEVGGIFSCDNCTMLRDLTGAPKKVELFACNWCSGLTTLSGTLEECEGLTCQNCTSLVSLKGLRKTTVKNSITCTGCTNLSSLEGCPTGIKEINVRSCPSLKYIEFIPQGCKVHADANVINLLAKQLSKNSSGMDLATKVKEWVKIADNYVDKFTVNSDGTVDFNNFTLSDKIDYKPEWLNIGKIRCLSIWDKDSESIKKWIPKEVEIITIRNCDKITDLTCLEGLERASDLTIASCKNLQSTRGLSHLTLRLIEISDCGKLSKLEGFPKMSGHSPSISISHTSIKNTDGMCNDPVSRFILSYNSKLTDITDTPKTTQVLAVLGSPKLNSLKNCPDVVNSEAYQYFSIEGDRYNVSLANIGVENLEGLGSKDLVSVCIKDCKKLKSLDCDKLKYDVIKAQKCPALERTGDTIDSCDKFKFVNCPSLVVDETLKNFNPTYAYFKKCPKVPTRDKLKEMLPPGCKIYNV